ncbi:MAG: acylneuraminate cytidylyltransferase family protein [Eubacteriales bacterium]
MKNIAIIPARSGSKGVIDKNIRLLNGKPLLAHTIESARESGVFDTIVVSTDSQQYADVAIVCGGRVPFLREPKLADDYANSWDVVRSVIHRLEQIGEYYDTIMLLQPTSPLRSGLHIQEAYELYVNNHAKAVVSVCETAHSPLWCNTLPENHSLCNFIPSEVRGLTRQELPTYYQLNGAIYLIQRNQLEEEITLYTEDSYAYLMNQNESMDIDTELDFLLAEAYMQQEKVT